MAKSKPARPTLPMGGAPMQFGPSTPAAVFQQALQLHRQGLLPQAQRLYEQILGVHARHFGAAHMLGVLYYQMGRYAEAHRWLVKALQIDANDASVHTNLGLVLGAVGRHAEALQCHNKSLDMRPEFVEAWVNRGGALKELRQFQDALNSYDKALELNSQMPQAQLNRGIVLCELNRPTEALAAFDALTSAHQGYAQAWHHRGNALAMLGKFEEAAGCFNQATALAPEYAPVWVDKCLLSASLGQTDEALAHLDRALTIHPSYAPAHTRRGDLLRQNGRFTEAVVAYTRALEFNPTQADALFGMASIEVMLGDKASALDHLDAALQLQPDMTPALVTRSGLFREAGLFPEALVDLQRLARLTESSHPSLFMPDLLLAQACMCDWSDWNHQIAQLSVAQTAQASPVSPFPRLILSDDPAAHRAACAQFAALDGPPDHILGPIAARPPGNRIRVGYFSADFHDHATLRLMASLFELHDRTQFEWYAFSFGPNKPDPLQQRARAAFDHFIDVQHLSALEIATRARELQIDVAVDLKGFTQDCRVQIFAARVAPVQVNYLGYPGTMATGYHDYIVADAVLIPDDQKIHYAEKVVRLPISYQVNDRKRQVSNRQFSRQECGLPENAFVFVCFNAVSKIMPDVFASWMRILTAVPHGVLWLFEGNQWAPDNLRAQASRLGVNAQRLVFAPNLLNPEHIARLQLADLFLDTSPYNAHTTASDALWMGVPLVTRVGQSFAARVAASLLKSVHLPELVTHTNEEYEAIAISIAKDPVRLQALKQHLHEQRESTPLFDPAQHARHLEAAYKQMIQQWHNQLPPDHFDVAPSPA